MFKYNQICSFFGLQIPWECLFVMANRTEVCLSFLLCLTATDSHLVVPLEPTVYLRSFTTPTPCHRHPRRAPPPPDRAASASASSTAWKGERTSTHRALIAGSSLLKTAKHKVVYPWGGSRLGGKVAGSRARTSRSGRDAIPHVASCRRALAGDVCNAAPIFGGPNSVEYTDLVSYYFWFILSRWFEN